MQLHKVSTQFTNLCCFELEVDRRQMSQDAKLFARGKVEELRAELQADKKDKGFAKRRITLKKVRPRRVDFNGCHP